MVSHHCIKFQIIATLSANLKLFGKIVVGGGSSGSLIFKLGCSFLEMKLQLFQYLELEK